MSRNPGVYEYSSLCKCKLHSQILNNASKINDVEKQLSDEIHRLKLQLDTTIRNIPSEISSANDPKKNFSKNIPSQPDGDVSSCESSLSPHAAPFLPSHSSPPVDPEKLQEAPLSSNDSVEDFEFEFDNLNYFLPTSQI